MFRKLSFALLALALASCAALPLAGSAASVLLGGPTPPAIQAVGQTVVLDGSKALAMAHLTYESVGAAALAGLIYPGATTPRTQQARRRTRQAPCKQSTR
jgi:hypothetical protein